jgi:cysteine desulfurase
LLRLLPLSAFDVLTMTYLDHNASSPLLPQARAAWLEAVEHFPGNPSSQHRLGTRAERALENAARQVASFLGCAPTDILWTSGATEACNTAIHHAAATAPASAPAWISAIEHPAVIDSARHAFRDRLRFIPVDRRGVVEIGWVETQLKHERPALVAVMAANNETGVLQPWRELQALCAQREVSFFCDATQWLGRLPAEGLGACAFVAGSAHKFGGPRGVGFLKVPGGVSFTPFLRGGPQQERRRAGTENVPGILALAAALTWCEEQIARGEARARAQQRDYFIRELTRAVPEVALNGQDTERLWNTVSVVMPSADCRVRWVVKLDKAGFAVSTGSACSSGSEAPSHVLSAMDITPAQAASALRFSSGWLTPASDWDNLRAALGKIHADY